MKAWIRSALLATCTALVAGCGSADAPPGPTGTGGSSSGAGGTSDTASAGALAAGGMAGAPATTAGSSGVSGGGGTSALPADWFDAAWTRRWKVKVSDAQLTEKLEQFQVLVRLDAQSFDYASAQATGADLRFVTQDKVVLKHEVEKWDATGESLIWLLLPALDATPLELWLYSGNAQAMAPAEPERRAVWPEPYAAVWHLAGDVNDSAPSAYAAQNNGGSFVAGKLGQGMKLSRPSKQYVIISPNAPIPILSGANGSTFSAWVNAEGIDGGPNDGTDEQDNGSIIMTIGGGSLGNHNSYCDANISYEGRMISHVDPADVGSYRRVRSNPGAAQRNEWIWVTYVVDLAAGEVRFYKNGAAVGAFTEGAFNATSYAASASLKVVIGTEEDLTKHFWDGSLDELRLEKGMRSPAWIAAQFRAMTTAAYVTVSAQ